MFAFLKKIFGKPEQTTTPEAAYKIEAPAPVIESTPELKVVTAPVVEIKPGPVAEKKPTTPKAPAKPKAPPKPKAPLKPRAPKKTVAK